MARNGRLTIGDISRATGCKVPTIRYYEEIGLITPPARSSGNQRLYSKAQLDRLTFVRHARELGFQIDSTRQLLSLVDQPSQPCAAADAIARKQLQEVDHRIVQLQTLKRQLERMIEQCRGGRIADCRIIEVLGDHSKCLTVDHKNPEVHR